MAQAPFSPLVWRRNRQVFCESLSGRNLLSSQRPPKSIVLTSLVRSRNTTTFQPFTLGEFTCSGTTYDTQSFQDVSAADLISVIIDDYLRMIGNQRSLVEAESIYVDYSGVRGEVKVTTEFLFEGGGSYRVGYSVDSCERMIYLLIQGLRRREPLNDHPIQVTMARNGRRLIRVTVVIERGQRAEIATGRTINFSGLIYPNRRAEISGMSQNLKDMMTTLTNQGLTRKVRFGYRTAILQQGTHVILSLGQGGRQDFPDFTFINVVQIVQTIKNFYTIRGFGAYLVGGIYHSGQQVGILTVELQPRPLPFLE